MAWIDAHAPPEAIVATTSPHLCYLLTGRHAVLPPMEIDPAHARRLLEAVPVSYVIVDEFSSHRLFASLCPSRGGERSGLLGPRARNR